MREVITMEILASKLVGTWHHGPAGRQVSAVAVMILNSGDIRRAGPADTSAHLGDRLAAKGYPVFRFDMPGLGDSPGELPAHQETLWRVIETGGKSPMLCGLLDALKKRFAFSGFVLAGLCGGAEAAVHVAMQRRQDVKGVMLFEMPVLYTPEVPGERMPGEARSVKDLLKAAARTGARRTKELANGNRLSGAMLGLALKLKRQVAAKPRMSEGAAVHDHPNRNRVTLEAWRGIRAVKLPTLMAYTTKTKLPTEAVLLPSGCPAEVKSVDLGYTNHLLTGGGGKTRLLEAVEAWLMETFPATAVEISQRVENGRAA